MCACPTTVDVAITDRSACKTELTSNIGAALGILEVAVPAIPFGVDSHLTLAEVIGDFRPEVVGHVRGQRASLEQVVQPSGSLQTHFVVENWLEVGIEQVTTVGNQNFIEATAEAFFFTCPLSTPEVIAGLGKECSLIANFFLSKGCGKVVTKLLFEGLLVCRIAIQVRAVVNDADIGMTGDHVEMTVFGGSLDDGGAEL